MGVPVQEHDHQQASTADLDKLSALLQTRPALQLAGEDDNESEPHIWRGID